MYFAFLRFALIADLLIRVDTRSPVLWIGAALTLLLRFGITDLGTDGLVYVTWGTFAAVALTFLPEKLFGKYRTTPDMD